MLARLLLVAAVAWSASTQARDLAINADDLIHVDLASVGIVTMTGSPVVLLREPDSGDIVPIFVGGAEARAIHMALQGVEPPRPMTHDLLSDVLEKLDAKMEEAIVDELRDNTYYGAVRLRLGSNGDSLLIDARPSDAIALAARTGARILVAPDVLQSAEGIPYDGLGDDDIVTALGITVVVATDELREAMNLPDEDGVLVSAVRGPAGSEGMQAGDLITSVDGETPRRPQDFLRIIRDSDADQLTIEFRQDGERKSLDLPADLVVPREPAGEVL